MVTFLSVFNTAIRNRYSFLESRVTGSQRTENPRLARSRRHPSSSPGNSWSQKDTPRRQTECDSSNLRVHHCLHPSSQTMDIKQCLVQISLRETSVLIYFVNLKIASPALSPWQP